MREFKILSGKRYVAAYINSFQVYHPECAPEGSVESWVTTQKTICAKCHIAIYKRKFKY